MTAQDHILTIFEGIDMTQRKIATQLKSRTSRHVSYLVMSVKDRPIASFADKGRAFDFQQDRMAKGTAVKVAKVETVITYLDPKRDCEP